MANMLKGCFVDKVIHVTSLFTAFEVTRPEDYRFEGESHDFWEIVCVAEGKLGVTAGTDLFRLESGMAVIHRPMEFHCLWSEENTCPHIIVMSFSAEKMPDFSGKLFSLSEREFQEIRSLRAKSEEIFEIEGIRVCSVPAGKESAAHIFVSRFENLLLDMISGQNSDIQSVSSPRAMNFRRLAGFLEQHLNESLRISDIADFGNMSEAGVKKLFQKYTGIGVMNYFLRMKLQAALTLLRKGMSVKETAAAFGFEDPNYFSVVFKRIYGMPPTVWQKEQAGLGGLSPL